jgi:SAM-dependent methyltransferase
MTTISYPPLRLRKSVGPTEEKYYENPSGCLVFERNIPAENYRTIFDFGCGCGRVARQLILQTEAKVESYCGEDLFRDSIEWARQNLTPANPSFQFRHHNVFNAQFNPSTAQEVAAFTANNNFFTLVTAHSVFTHIIERNLKHYISECARILTPNGIFRSSWFLFDKTGFPMMQEFQNCLYINVYDPTNATIYDYNYIRSLFRENGMTIYSIVPPPIRGFQWFLFAKPSSAEVNEADFPDDIAPLGICLPPINISE